jgi:hypothetical protein
LPGKHWQVRLCVVVLMLDADIFLDTHITTICLAHHTEREGKTLKETTLKETKLKILMVTKKASYRHAKRLDINTFGVRIRLEHY